MAEPFRTLLLAITAFTALGMLAELLLLEHYDGWRQRVPLALLGLCLVAFATVARRRSRRALTLVRCVAIGCVVAGCAGIYLHLRGNAEFEREMAPATSGLALLWESLRGATPALAPGAMVHVGLAGWLYTLRHPAWRRSESS